MSSSISSSRRRPAVKIVKNIRNTFNNIFHNYPKLPDFPLSEENLPFQIGKNVSVKEYNTFLDHNQSTGYKFYWENKNVYIIEMANSEHEMSAALLIKIFDRPNNGVLRGPIKMCGQPCKEVSFSLFGFWLVITIHFSSIVHYNPIGHGEKMAPDVAVYPSTAHVPRPNIPHPGPPPSDKCGLPHARIIVEIANVQSLDNLITRCETWLRQQFVRDVLGIKLDVIRSHQGNVHRSMLAMLWTRQNVSPTAPAGYTAPAGFIVSTNPNLPRVSFRLWDFGTLLYGTTNATACIAPGLPAYQVTIPIEDVFWNPPIVMDPTTNTNVPNETNYTITVPGTITVPNFIIDLYEIQQEVMENQRV